jgi:hypothetical protein
VLDGAHVHGEMINNNAARWISDPVAARARSVAVPGGGEARYELMSGTTTGDGSGCGQPGHR